MLQPLGMGSLEELCIDNRIFLGAYGPARTINSPPTPNLIYHYSTTEALVSTERLVFDA